MLAPNPVDEGVAAAPQGESQCVTFAWRWSALLEGVTSAAPTARRTDTDLDSDARDEMKEVPCMHDNPVLGRQLLWSQRRIRPLVAAAAPRDPMLAIQVGHVMLDDIEAMVAALDAEDLTRLGPVERVVRCRERLAMCESALSVIHDARTLVEVACAEARP